MSHQLRIWDLPTRLFHWSLAACIPCLLITAELGGDAMVWHFRFGYAALTLLLFRLVWGLIGGYWSRFASFLFGPRQVLRYLRGQAPLEHTLGHNPLGALSVFGLLLFLLLQCASGLFSDDEISNSGPLAARASGRVVEGATFYHTEVGIVVLMTLVGLHLAAILFYFLRRGDNLVKPMLTGDKLAAQPAPTSRDDLRSRLLALVVLLVCAAGVALLVNA